MFNAWSLRACHAESKESPSITSYELQLLFAFDHRAFAGGAGGTEKKKDDGPLVKICRDTSKLATEQVREHAIRGGYGALAGGRQRQSLGKGGRGTVRSCATAST